jgi:hypothetical protein
VPRERVVEHLDDGARRPLRAARAAARPRALLAGQDRVAVHRAVHAAARDEQVRPVGDEHEAEALRPDGDPSGDLARELGQRILFAAGADDLAPALEGVQSVPERIFLPIGDVEFCRELAERQDP